MDKCPCGASLPRQKCIHDLGGDCARHEDKESSQIAQLTAENERLLRVVEQAKKAGKLRLSPEKTLIISGFGYRWEKPRDVTPDLYAELLKDAQLKEANRG